MTAKNKISGGRKLGVKKRPTVTKKLQKVKTEAVNLMPKKWQKTLFKGD